MVPTRINVQQAKRTTKATVIPRTSAIIHLRRGPLCAALGRNAERFSPSRLPEVGALMTWSSVWRSASA